jgi:hypothetical protein
MAQSRIKIPTPDQFSPDPAERPTLEDCRAWMDNPLSRLILARLRRLAWRRASSDATTQWELTKSTLLAQGVSESLNEIERTVNSVRSTENTNE